MSSSSQISIYDYLNIIGKNALPIKLDKISNWSPSVTCNTRAATYLPMQAQKVIPLIQDNTINGVFSFTPFWITNKSRQFKIDFIPSRGSVIVRRIKDEYMNENLSCADEPFDDSEIEYLWEKSIPYSNVDSILLLIFRAGGSTPDS